MFIELEQDNLQDIITQNTKVFVQYSASWCGNCKIMKPKFKHHASQHEDVTWVLVDAEQFPDSRQLAEVTNLPTFAVFESGTLKGQIQTNKAEVLQEFIQTH
ncbi:MAG: thioredoxin family protein [Flavobacterium sp.]|jgi:thiol-disulfide isomerase/thioredoxin|nr:thioredoxin family protein [Flavobacterium sp.]